jgi:hypothetical protein
MATVAGTVATVAGTVRYHHGGGHWGHGGVWIPGAILGGGALAYRTTAAVTRVLVATISRNTPELAIPNIDTSKDGLRAVSRSVRRTVSSNAPSDALTPVMVRRV